VNEIQQLLTQKSFQDELKQGTNDLIQKMNTFFIKYKVSYRNNLMSFSLDEEYDNNKIIRSDSEYIMFYFK
jgi:hypothetical protein